MVRSRLFFVHAMDVRKIIGVALRATRSKPTPAAGSAYLQAEVHCATPVRLAVRGAQSDGSSGAVSASIQHVPHAFRVFVLRRLPTCAQAGHTIYLGQFDPCTSNLPPLSPPKRSRCPPSGSQAHTAAGPPSAAVTETAAELSAAWPAVGPLPDGATGLVTMEDAMAVALTDDDVRVPMPDGGTGISGGLPDEMLGALGEHDLMDLLESVLF